MMRNLIEKELRQHAKALSLLFLLLLSGLAFIARNRFLNALSGTPFAALRNVLWTFLPLACLVLSHTLVVTEYRHKTQLFLEGLPLPRWRMLALKYGLGMALLLAAVGAAFTVTWKRTTGVDVVTTRFLLLLALRSTCFTWFLWSLAFAHGFMGRYRLLFGVVTICFIAAPIVIGNVELAQYGPFALTGDSFAYERHLLPLTELSVTAGYALFWTCVGFFLGLARDATIASALSSRMSPREKIVITFAVFAAVVSLATYADHSEAATPIHVPGGIDITRGAVTITTTAAEEPSESELSALNRIATRIAEELASVADFLRTDQMPPIFLVHRRDLSPGHIENAELKPTQGLMLRANVTAEGLSEDTLLRWIVREALVAKSLGRLKLEHGAWVLDAFTSWWPHRHHALRQDPKRLESAVRAMPPDFSVRDLNRWLSFRQTKGDEIASTLAATGLQVLVEQKGEEACRRFLHSVLAVSITKDARPWLRDVCYPVPKRFHQSTGQPLEAFVSEWRHALSEAEAALPPRFQETFPQMRP